jgi:hypothetical protein
VPSGGRCQTKFYTACLGTRSQLVQALVFWLSRDQF